MLKDCRRVALVNTGTSPEANASSTARLAEHLNMGSDDCIVYATTEESLAAARRAQKLLEETLKQHKAPKVMIDADILGRCVYHGLPIEPKEAIAALRELIGSLAEQLAAVDTTGGMKLEAVIAALAATSLAAKRAKENEEPIRVTYTPGEAFSRPIGLRPVSGSGWWSGQHYPRTPRGLQPLVELSLDLKSGIHAAQSTAAAPALISPPDTIVLRPLDKPQTLHSALGDTTRLLNHLAAKTIVVRIRARDGRKMKVLETDWSQLKIVWTQRWLENPGEETLDGPAETLSGTGLDSKKAKQCLSALVKLAAHQPMVVKTTGETLEKGSLSTLLTGYADRVTPRPLLLDTSSLLSGGLNALLAAETALALRGRRPRTRRPLLLIHPCTIAELRRFFEYAKRNYGVINPCTGLAVLAHLHLVHMKILEDQPSNYCDPVLPDAARKNNAVLVTADQGLYNMTSSLSDIEAAYILPTPLWRISDPMIAQHAAAAATTQIVIALAAAANPDNAALIAEGDHYSAKLMSKTHTAIKVNVY